MNELVVIGEGETEQTFVRDQLAGHLALHGVSVWGVLPGRYRSSGGVRKWGAARQERAAVVESQIASEVQQFTGDKFNPKFFIPYVQLHEFEALAFAEVSQLTSVVAPLCGRSAESLQTAFAEIVAEAGHPEAINDGYATCPSRRIATIVPAYRKRVHGPIVTRRIGLEVLRSRCSHFASWLARLENIGAE